MLDYNLINLRFLVKNIDRSSTFCSDHCGSSSSQPELLILLQYTHLHTYTVTLAESKDALDLVICHTSLYLDDILIKFRAASESYKKEFGIIRQFIYTCKPEQQTMIYIL